MALMEYFLTTFHPISVTPYLYINNLSIQMQSAGYFTDKLKKRCFFNGTRYCGNTPGPQVAVPTPACSGIQMHSQQSIAFQFIDMAGLLIIHPRKE